MSEERSFASYQQGTILRIASGILIEIVSVVAYLFKIIHKENLVGISASIAFLVLMCVAFYPFMKSTIDTTNSSFVSLLDRLFEIVGFTGVIYSLGGVEATYLLPIYFLNMAYYIIATPRKLPFSTATVSVASFALIVLLEHYGMIPHLSVNKGVSPPFENQLAIIGVTAVLLYEGAFLTSSAARIVERSRAELSAQNSELEKAKNEAQESNKLKSAFLAQMSHELRTPLHHILGFTEFVLDETRPELTSMQREALGDVLKSGKHLLSIINDMLDISRLEAGKQELENAEVDVKTLLEEGLTVVKDSAQKGGVELTARIGEVSARVWADERKLRQVLYNLLSNAVKFTPPGGKIEVSAVTEGASVLVKCIFL